MKTHVLRILYHLATLPPRLPAAEAISQEISVLQGHFGGEVIYINPNQKFPLYIPRLLFGFHKLRDLRKQEAGLQLHHFYNPDPFPFPYLRQLQRPVIYSVTCGVTDRRPNLAFFSSLAAVAASDERSLERLKAWGLDNTFLLRPGIDAGRFTCSPRPLQSDLRLMVGSAPWTRGQFKSKGVEALLAAAQRSPRLHLVFLWRGILFEEMERRVHEMDLERQVTLINEVVEVNRVLADVHASITLAESPAIIKSYPHSLLDSLAAGKPVLVSQAIPMSDYVERTGCGKVVREVTPEAILDALEELKQDYQAAAEAAQQVGQRDFSQQAMLASFQRLYEHVLKSARPLL